MRGRKRKNPPPEIKALQPWPRFKPLKETPGQRETRLGEDKLYHTLRLELKEKPHNEFLRNMLGQIIDGTLSPEDREALERTFQEQMKRIKLHKEPVREEFKKILEQLEREIEKRLLAHPELYTLGEILERIRSGTITEEEIRGLAKRFL